MLLMSLDVDNAVEHISSIEGGVLGGGSLGAHLVVDSARTVHILHILLYVPCSPRLNTTPSVCSSTVIIVFDYILY